MINASIKMEKFLQEYRFKEAKGNLIGDVLDFGGNKGELKRFVNGKYTLINYDHSPMEEKTFDTIAVLAVIEHINFDEVFKIFSTFKKKLRPKGRIIITTPTKISSPILEVLSFLGIIERENILEHKHYWSKKEIYMLAEKNGFKIKKYTLFQFVFNQIAVFEHDDKE